MTIAYDLRVDHASAQSRSRSSAVLWPCRTRALPQVEDRTCVSGHACILNALSTGIGISPFSDHVGMHQYDRIHVLDTCGVDVREGHGSRAHGKIGETQSVGSGIYPESLGFHEAKGKHGGIM